MAYTTTLTNAGTALLSGVMTDPTKRIIFTGIQIGGGTYPPGTDIAAQTGLAPAPGIPIINAGIDEIEKVDDRYVRLVSTFSNTTNESTYTVTEIGLFAKESEDATPVMYAYIAITDGDGGTVPANTSVRIERKFTINVYVGSAEQTIAELSPTGYATKEELRQHNESLSAHEDRFAAITPESIGAAVAGTYAGAEVNGGAANIAKRVENVLKFRKTQNDNSGVDYDGSIARRITYAEVGAAPAAPDGMSYVVAPSGGNVPLADEAVTARKTAGAITFKSDGSGANPGATFDGSTPRSVSYNTVGAAAANHTHNFNYAGSSSNGGPANSVAQPVTFKKSRGASSGTSYNGSVAATITYEEVGAAAESHLHKKLTFKKEGDGAASPSEYDGSTARTISYNTLGAAPARNNVGENKVALVGSAAYGWKSYEVDFLCDGVDDQVEINNAINLVTQRNGEHGGGRVVILDGTYNINGDVIAGAGSGNADINKPVELYGSGNVVFNLQTNTSTTPERNYRVEISRNRSSVENIRFAATGIKQTPEASSGCYAHDCASFSLSRCSFSLCGATLTRCYYASVTDNYFVDGYDGVDVDRGSYNSITGNRITGTQDAISVVLEQGDTISGNTIRVNTSTSGARVKSHGVSVSQCDRITVSGNTVLATYRAVYVNNSQMVAVNGNVADADDSSGYPYASICLSSCEGCSIVGNSSHIAGTGTRERGCVYILDSQYSVVGMNTIKMNSADMSYAVVQDGTSANNTVYGNQVMPE